jgi:biotin synthase
MYINNKSNSIEDIINKAKLDLYDLITILSAESDEDLELLRLKAYNTMLDYIGNKVYMRGLIEFSNICTLDCYYCGIRKSNNKNERYILSKEEIIETAKWIASKNYASLVLQSGERQDEQFISFLVDVINTIKEETKTDKLPDGLGITLSVGEQTLENYHRLYNAGAHRYLLRIESSNSKLFAKLHPENQSYISRIEALKNIKKSGMQLGTGVMIGFPGQTVEDLANDIIFFKEIDADMIGMGPYIVHNDTPMNIYLEQNKKDMLKIYNLALKMIAATRIFLKDVNIASTTALQAINYFGREEGLRFGANIIMPQTTPIEYRKEYQLYEGKPCLDDIAEECAICVQNRIQSIGRPIGYNEWGDSRHFLKR